MRETFIKLIPPEPKILKITPYLKHNIDVQRHPPIRQGTCRYTHHILKITQDEMHKMLAEGIIEPSESPWCSWPVLHRKPNEKYRFCIDFRKVNEVTKHDSVPIQNLDGLLDQLQRAVCISKLDLSNAFLLCQSCINPYGIRLYGEY